MGLEDPLQAIWEATSVVAYLDAHRVHWPDYRLDGSSPGSLSAEVCIEVATHCKPLTARDDIHVEIRRHRPGPPKRHHFQLS